MIEYKNAYSILDWFGHCIMYSTVFIVIRKRIKGDEYMNTGDRTTVVQFHRFTCLRPTLHSPRQFHSRRRSVHDPPILCSEHPQYFLPVYAPVQRYVFPTYPCVSFGLLFHILSVDLPLAAASHISSGSPVQNPPSSPSSHISHL